MQISGQGIPPLFRLSLTAPSLKAMPLHDGDTVTATVLGSNTPGKLNLDINGKLLQVVSTLRLTAGMTLQLRVEKNNDQLLLHLDDKTVQQLTRNQALRQSLPLQEPLKPLFERLQQLASLTAKTATAESATAQGTAPSPGTAPAKAAATPAAHTATPSTTQDNAATSDRQGSAAKTAAAPQADIARTSQGESAQALPRHLQQAVERLLAVLPLIKQISEADGLKQAIASSGLFLESSLLHPQQSSSPDKDVKTALLRLARTIRQSLAIEGGEQHAEVTRSREMLQGLLRQVDAGLARIQLHQLSSITAQQAQGDERQLMTLELELPLLQPQEKGIELLQLKIQRERAKKGSGAEDCWSVTLHLSPADYGDIQAVVSLSSGKISTTFWCQEEHTGKLFRQQLDELQQRLSDQGLEVGRCTAITGTAPESHSPATYAESSGLIDTRA
jgi:hypothetical protein